jgi:hypothetical protein
MRRISLSFLKIVSAPGAPQVGLSTAILRMRALVSLDTRGLSFLRIGCGPTNRPNEGLEQGLR